MSEAHKTLFGATKVQGLRGFSALLGLSMMLLVACGGEPVVLPAVEPLKADAAALNSLYGLQGGGFAVKLSEEIVLHDPNQARDIPLRVSYPDAPGPFPLILFSHGNWSDNVKYDKVLDHWVSHGYVVLAPQHLDGGGMARGIFNALRFGQLGLIDARRADMDFLLDNIDSVISALPALQRRIDRERVAVAGHSFGAFTAQQFGGAAALDVGSGQYGVRPDARVRAVVAISPPGPMFDLITEDSWRQMKGPMLLTTGTWDVNAKFFPQWELHRMSFDTAVPGDQYALVVQGADHYLGNLICRPEREEAPQTDALAMVNATTTAFLDAYVKDNANALAFVRGDRLNDITQGFAVLSRRD